MVVRQEAGRESGREEEDGVDRLFHALADPTRRDILQVVLATEQSVSDLARRYPMSFAAVQKHVAVLERAGLVAKRRRGREQLVRGDIEALQVVDRLLDRYEAVWRSRIDRMGQALAEATGDAAVPAERTTDERQDR